LNDVTSPQNPLFTNSCSMKSFKEFDFIQSLPNLDSHGLLMGIGDDAAVFEGQHSWSISSDAMAERTHFNSDDDPEAIGKKLVSINLSDMAAMACEPRFFLLQLHLGKAWQSEEKLSKLKKGILDQLKKYNVPLIGGDTICTEENGLQLSGTILGSPYSFASVARSGAMEGDVIAVTGKLGGSFPKRHLNFEPRVDWSKSLNQSLHIHSLMDISDGLAGDLRHLCHRSEVHAEIDLYKLPIHPDVQSDPDPFLRALCDGEDYELLFTCRPEDFVRIPQDVPVTDIGRIVEGEDAQIKFRRSPDDDYEMMDLKGFEHGDSQKP